MSFKDKDVQPEFFSELEKKQKKNYFEKNMFFNNYRSSIPISVDNLIVTFIIFVMINLLSFAFGIERGKRLLKLNTKSIKQEVTVKRPISDKKNVVTAPKPKAEEKVVTPVPVASPEKEIKEGTYNTEFADKDGYIIQLVTYSTNSAAERELEKLKTSGREVFIKEQGKYFVICSGVYKNKQIARNNINQFKKRYKDCFVCKF